MGTTILKTFHCSQKHANEQKKLQVIEGPGFEKGWISKERIHCKGLYNPIFGSHARTCARDAPVRRRQGPRTDSARPAARRAAAAWARRAPARARGPGRFPRGGRPAARARCGTRRPSSQWPAAVDRKEEQKRKQALQIYGATIACLEGAARWNAGMAFIGNAARAHRLACRCVRATACIRQTCMNLKISIRI